MKPFIILLLIIAVVGGCSRKKPSFLSERAFRSLLSNEVKQKLYSDKIVGSFKFDSNKIKESFKFALNKVNLFLKKNEAHNSFRVFLSLDKFIQKDKYNMNLLCSVLLKDEIYLLIKNGSHEIVLEYIEYEKIIDIIEINRGKLNFTKKDKVFEIYYYYKEK